MRAKEITKECSENIWNMPAPSCAANFYSFAQLAKRKSLGRSKPATNPKHKH
jgi:hypothetical protein